MTQGFKGWRTAFYLTWLVLLFVQAFFTELMNDEALYWYWSQYPSLGYHDHPPMIAFWILAGNSWFPGEFGVRLFSLLSGLATIWFIERSIDQLNFKLFAGIISTMLILQLGGFMAVPDSPFLFFSALFFLLLKRYLKDFGFGTAILLGIVAAGLMYSKYHGAMVLFFMVLFNPYLLKKGSFYLVILTATLVYLPHLIWLFNHDFPSIKYHFVDRNIPTYSFWEATGGFILGQLVIYGPISSFLILFAVFAHKVEEKYLKLIKRTTIGVLLFLFVFSFGGNIVEGNWSLGIAPLLVIFSHDWLGKKKNLRKYFYYTVPVSLALILTIRVYFIHDFLPGYNFSTFQVHGQRKWVEALHDKAGDRPVVFTNSYQKSSVYSFYSGEMSVSHNNTMGRPNQFSLWPIEMNLQGKDVLLVTNYGIEGGEQFMIHNKPNWLREVQGYSSYYNVKFELENYEVLATDSLEVRCMVSNRYGHIKNRFYKNPELPAVITYHYFEKRKLVLEGSTNVLFNPEMIGESVTLKLPVPPNGKNELRISIRCGWLPSSLNSDFFRIEVTS